MARAGMSHISIPPSASKRTTKGSGRCRNRRRPGGVGRDNGARLCLPCAWTMQDQLVDTLYDVTLEWRQDNMDSTIIAATITAIGTIAASLIGLLTLYRRK